MIAPPSGTGYLGGDAPNVVQINGQPHQCTVDLYCNSEWCGTQETLADGSWRFSYLDIASTFDIIARGAPLLDDIISSRRTPYAMAVIASDRMIHDFEMYEYHSAPGITLPITGTPGPYTFSVVAGTAPSGITFTDVSGSLVISGGSDAPGTYKFKLKIFSSILADFCIIDVVVLIQPTTMAIIHADGDFTNSNLASLRWEAFSNAKASTAQSKFYGSSFAFDGVESYIRTTSPLSLTLDDFTVESWAMVSDLSESRCIFDSRLVNSSNAFAVAIKPTGVVYFYRSFTGTLNDGSISVPTNTWFHWAVVKTGTTIKLYVDGNLSLTLTGITETFSSTILTIGKSIDTTGYRFQGYIQDFRLTLKAIYLANFIPPGPLPNNIDEDANYNSVFSLLRLVGNSNDTMVVNASSLLVQAAWTSANATVDTTTFKFGTGSIRLPGTGGVLSPSNNNFSMGSGDFTWECFFRYDSLISFQTIICNRADASTHTDQITLGIDNLGKIYVFSNAMIFPQTASGLLANTWAHIALSCYNGVGKVFLDGVQLGSTFTVPTLVNGQIGVGSNINNSEPMTGYIDEVRITKGLARYNANFTPPTAPFTY